MKILILGATGMAGHVITLYLQEAGHDVVGVSRKKAGFCNSNILGDATDFTFLKKIVLDGCYDAVINAVGILNEEAEKNKASAVLLNSYLPHYLADITREIKTKVVHLSTDCVFSGKQGGYVETSLKDGKTFYDRSKAMGEIENNKDLTFRTSIIGPDLSTLGKGLFNWFMSQKADIKGYTCVFWSGVTTIILAKAIECALSENLSGLYHLVNNDKISKFNLLLLFNKYLKNNEISVLKFDKLKKDKSLLDTRKSFSFEVPTYEAMIIDMKNWTFSHKNFYPHYLRGE